MTPVVPKALATRGRLPAETLAKDAAVRRKNHVSGVSLNSGMKTVRVTGNAIRTPMPKLSGPTNADRVAETAVHLPAAPRDREDHPKAIRSHGLP